MAKVTELIKNNAWRQYFGLPKKFSNNCANLSNFLKISLVATNLDRKKPSLNFPKLNRFFRFFGAETFTVYLPVSIPGLLLTISHFLIIDLWGENHLLSSFPNDGGFPSKSSRENKLVTEKITGIFVRFFLDVPHNIL